MFQIRLRSAGPFFAGLSATLLVAAAWLGGPAFAQSVGLTNTATVTAPAGTTDIVPDNNVDTATVMVAPGYSFCTMPGGNATSNA
ncbi:hypothetical protein, partial [Sphingomonas sp.]|uniref:hypothetical protein n=1 Tax=Sphingomonas sp. TaxID=28214 RepID=UPI003B3B8595